MSGLLVFIIGNEHSKMISKPGLCISYCANILGKGINPTILLPAMGK